MVNFPSPDSNNDGVKFVAVHRPGHSDPEIGRQTDKKIFILPVICARECLYVPN